MKGIQRVISVRDIKSIHSIGGSSVPKAQRSAYLELYVSGREKDRLEKEIFVLNKRRTTAQKLLNSVYKRIEKLQAEVSEEHKIKTCKSVPGKPMKKLSIQY